VYSLRSVSQTLLPDAKGKTRVQKCQRIGVRGGPVEGEREEGGKMTLTQNEFIMQPLIAYALNDNTASLLTFLA